MEQKDYRLAAIMYTDIAGFSRMMESDEAGTLELLRYHNDLISGIVAAHHGTVIKTIGDALLVDFKNTVEAMQSALEIQDRLYARNKETSPGQPLLIRIGLHLGDIYFYENDALGEGINIAARLQSLARPGCICFSQDVYNIVLNKIEFHSEKLGKVSLKNITKEIHAYEIVSPNVEFDPDRDKPRPGYSPASYLKEGEPAPYPQHAAMTPVMGSSQPAAPRSEPDRDYSPEGSRAVLGQIRDSILRDAKSVGRRMNVSEALSRYGHYGVEAEEVIARMAEDGFILRDRESLKGRFLNRDDRAARKAALKAEAESPEGMAKAFKDYKDSVGKRERRLRSFFKGHLFVFLALNAFLCFLNLTAGGKFPWSAIVVASTAIGLSLNAVLAWQASKRKGELESMPILDQAQLKGYKKMSRSKSWLAVDAAATATISLLLAVINGITGLAFPWFIIPTAALSVILIGHFFTCRTRMPEREKNLLSSLGVDGTWSEFFSRGRERKNDAADLGPYAPLYQEAEVTRQEIIAQLRSGKAGPLDVDLEPSLNECVSQVRLLAQSANEVDALIGSIPLEELGRDKALLATREASAQSEALKSEYRKSIAEIEKQESSHAALKEESEVLRLRLGSSVNQLKQLRLDISRAKLNPGEPGAGLDQLRKRTEELTLYLEDVRANYEGTKADPFIELEAAEKARIGQKGEA